jgi:integrase
MTVRLLKAEKVAELLDVKIQRIWELTREKKIPFIQIGDRQYRYSETALINWLENGLIFEFALLSGMRPEEYLGLQWKDLDFERYTAQVRRALVRHKGVWTFEKPKTAKSSRIISFPKQLFDRLKKHKIIQNQIRLKNGLVWENNDLIFCTDLGTPHTIPNLTYRYFRPLLKQSELPQIRLYDLRHSHATLLLIAEENPKVVAERLGHSTIVLTLDTYSHVIPTMQAEATNKLEKMMFGT